MNTQEKIEILAESAKYDASCASGCADGNRKNAKFGQRTMAGICHSWSADGRCVSLFKVLLSNDCAYNCAFCINRRSNDIPRATFEPEELVDLIVNLYRRNYIEGLFLSSGIWRSPDDTMARMIRVCQLLRTREGFGGYIHLKAIPGASEELIRQGGLIADRMSVNIELPSQTALTHLAPQKSKERILKPMAAIGANILANQDERKKSRGKHKPPSFVPAGQSTQMVIGASPDSDFQILRLSQSLYQRFDLKRVYYSAYVPVNQDNRLPALLQPPLKREHRLYQADWLVRLYGFAAEELVTPEQPDLDVHLDPKTGWALRHPQCFPIEINRADYQQLLRVPGIGFKSAQRICSSRRFAALRLEDLQKIGVVTKRALFFITINGHYFAGRNLEPDRLRHCLLTGNLKAATNPWQPELFPLLDELPATPQLRLDS